MPTSVAVNARYTPLRLSVPEERLAICRLDPREGIPAWATEAPFFSATRTPDELSVVCPKGSVPAGVEREEGWRALKLEGPFDLAQVGVLFSVSGPLADAGVSIFAVSTFDTDYVLVKEEKLEAAIAALRDCGHEIRGAGSGAVVRPATTDDEPFLWEMLYEAVSWGPEEAGPKPPAAELLAEPRLSRYLAGWGREGDFAVVALDAADGRRVGAAWYRLFPAGEPGYGFVDDATPEIAIAVAPDRRGMGVGGALLDALMDAAGSRGFDAISLSVQRSNPTAIALYAGRGFVRLSGEEGAWTMKAELPAAAAGGSGAEAREGE